MDDKIRRLADLVLNAGHAIALTGAGISTASGIPDFRSPGTGMWTKLDPLAAMSSNAFRADPARFYERLRPLVGQWHGAQPNAAHMALAQLERWGLLAGVITQNIDSLHQLAGSQHVWELHGHLRDATCVACGRSVHLNGEVERYLTTGDVPRCPDCGGILKLSMILFGEQLPRYIFIDVMGEISRSDLILVAGSSLTVSPAADLPLIARQHGAQIAIINDAATPLDGAATLVLRDRVERVLPQLAEICELELARRPRSEPGSEEGFRWSEPDSPLLGLSRLRDRLPSLPTMPRLPRPPSLDGLQATLWDIGAERIVLLDGLLMELAAQKAAKAATISRLRTLVRVRSRRAVRRAHRAASRMGTSLVGWRNR